MSARIPEAGRPEERPRAPLAPRARCRGCRHFRITHQPGRPYGCDLFGFRSRALPEVEVLRASGRECQGFAPRPPRRP